MDRKKSIDRLVVHFIGIGGIGMSALARYYKSHGCAVSGSDSAKSTITESIRKDAINVKIGHRKGNLPANVAVVVISQAIQPNNPELKEARQRGVRVLTYPEAIGELTREYKTIAVAGAHGKSTTTALAALAGIRGGFDPTVIVGVNLKEFGGKNFRHGKSDWLVLEADEFGRAFLNYSPFIAIATNIDREHLDVYKNLANIKSTFLKFFSNVHPGGALILNRDDKNLFSLKTRITAIAKKNKLRVVWYSIQGIGKNSGASLKLKKLRGVIKISGEHNLSNAMAVYELGEILKIPEEKIMEAIGVYRGAWRRMEYRGKFFLSNSKQSIPVYDDYAHHPTEIRATLKAFKDKFSGAPLVCVFQPHQAKRLQVLFREFTSAFTNADALVLIPSYTVAGRDAVASKFTAERLATAITKKYPRKKIYYLENPKRIKKILTYILPFLTKISSPAPVVVMMGAGDVVQYTDVLID